MSRTKRPRATRSAAGLALACALAAAAWVTVGQDAASSWTPVVRDVSSRPSGEGGSSDEIHADAAALIRLAEAQWGSPLNADANWGEEDLDWAVEELLRDIVVDACYEPTTTPGVEKAIPGAVITWLLADPEAAELLPPAGFRICRVRIAGYLEQPVPRTILPLYLEGCRFPERAVIEGHFAELSLAESRFERGLEIRESVIHGRLDLREIGREADVEYPAARRALRVHSTRVEGDLLLSCSREAIDRCDTFCWILDFQSVAVEGSLDLSRWVSDATADDRETPLICFKDVTIDGDFVAHSCLLRNPKGIALRAQHLRVGGDVFLDSGRALPDLDAAPNPDRIDLDAFTAQGSVIFVESTLDGVVVLGKAVLDAKERPEGALLFARTPVGHSLRISDLEVYGKVNMSGIAVAGGLLVERSSLYQSCLDLSHARIAGSVQLGPELMLRQSALTLEGAIIEGSVRCSGSSFDSGGAGCSLTVRNASISGDLDLGVQLDPDFPTLSCRGDVSLNGAWIDGSLRVERIDWADGSDFILCNAAVGCLVGMPQAERPAGWDRSRAVGQHASDELRDAWLNWPDPGRLDLRGFVYRSIRPAERLNVAALIDWLQLQQPEELAKDETGADDKTIPEEPEPPLESARLDSPVTTASGALEGKKQPIEQVPRSGCPGRAPPPKTAWPAPPAPASATFAQKDSTDKPITLYAEIDEAGPPAKAPSLAAERFPHASYRRLASVLEDMGHPQAAEGILIQRHRDIAKYTALHWWESAWKGIFGGLALYGYEPLRVVPWILGMVVIAVVFFGLGYQHELIVPAKVVDCGEPQRRFNVVMYALDVFLPIVKFGQVEHWALDANDPRRMRVPIAIPSAKTRRRVYLYGPRWVAILRLWLWLSIALGWMLTTFLVAGISGLLRT